MTGGESKERQVNREFLYEQVWAKPIRTLAGEYGISDVGLAKICARLNVPRPPVGYWARLQHGKPVERPPLLPAAPGQQTTATIEPTASRPTKPTTKIGAPQAPAPTVVVPDNLRRPHPAVQALQHKLRDRQPDFNGLLVIRAKDGTAFRTTKATRDRALRILDALFKALQERGHGVSAGEVPEDSYYRGLFRMVATVNGQNVDVSIGERRRRHERVPTANERSSMFTPGFDYLPSGDLVLHIGPRWGRSSARRTWEDGNRNRLEHLLGRVVLACECIAEELIREQQDRQQLELERAGQARIRAIEDARANHRKVLAADLADMANGWVTAKRIRDFLRALEQQLPADARTEGTCAWLAWAYKYAATIDPLRAPEKVAKRLEPDLGNLG